MESLNILHLSDLHFGNFKYPDPATLAISIVNRLDKESKKVDIVLVSGDVFDGRSKTHDEDEKNALRFFKTLLTKLKSRSISSPKMDEKQVLFVPGNHDLIRDEDGKKQYKKYDSFIKKFSGRKRTNKKHIIDKYNFVYDFPEKKIAILGFNSCRVEADSIKKEGLKWMDKVNFSDFDSNQIEKIKQSITAYKEKEISWDDFGYIDSLELDNVFEKLREVIPDYTDYTLIATFHHHFYPFPERQEKKPDTSFIRNYTEVLQQFQNYNIKLVLHGHKHTPVQRVITDREYFKDPEKLIYVLAAGSIGCSGVDNHSFHWLRVFEKKNIRLVDGLKFDYNSGEEVSPKTILLPPERSLKNANAYNLRGMLSNEDPKLYDIYHKITNDFDQCIQDSEIDQIIEKISDIITVFDEVNKSLRRVPLRIFIILLAINYRVIFLKNLIDGKDETLVALLARIEKELAKNLNDDSFANKLIQFLNAVNNKDIDETYSAIIKHVTTSQKQLAAYISITLFLTDLYLNISRYGETYFAREHLDFKINLKVKPKLFYNSIPSNSIEIESNPDRRAIYIKFKSKDPTVHKIAVLIVKDFEMRLSKFEKSLETINLKLYYIAPKVIPEKYELENFHFDAYIPTLLPLLTGDNLYDQKEVFIRELVQNAIDATLLRQKLQPEVDFNTDITIELGTCQRKGKKRKFFRITDQGTGMSKFTVERYFTSIGRSFYVSEEFSKLKKDNNITYHAISNFGIGFLSSFMVCSEVVVKTKHILSEEQGLEIEIPNYEGCFFVKTIDRATYGTEITLFQDDRTYPDDKPFMDFDKFEAYIKKVFHGLSLNVKIKGAKIFEVEAYRQQRAIIKAVKKGELVFYVPFSEETKSTISYKWEELQNTDINIFPKYGVSFNFSCQRVEFENFPDTFNEGLKLNNYFSEFIENPHLWHPKSQINFPSSFINLDVARESISNIKEGVDLSKISLILSNQINSFTTSNSETLKDTYINQYECIYTYHKFQLAEFDTTKLLPFTFAIEIKVRKFKLDVSIIRLVDIPKKNTEEKTFYLSFRHFNSFINCNKLFEIVSKMFFKQLFDFNDLLEDTNIKETEEKISEKISESTKLLERMNREERYRMRQMSEKKINGELKDVMYFMRKIKEEGSDLEGYLTNAVDNMQIIEMNEERERKENRNYELAFIYSSLLFIQRENEIRYWPLSPFYLIKQLIFHDVKIGDYKKFQCTIDFSKYNFRELQKRYKNQQKDQ